MENERCNINVIRTKYNILDVLLSVFTDRIIYMYLLFSDTEGVCFSLFNDKTITSLTKFYFSFKFCTQVELTSGRIFEFFTKILVKVCFIYLTYAVSCFNPESAEIL